MTRDRFFASPAFPAQLAGAYAREGTVAIVSATQWTDGRRAIEAAPPFSTLASIRSNARAVIEAASDNIINAVATLFLPPSPFPIDLVLAIHDARAV